MNAALRALVEDVVGPIRAVEDRSWPHAVTRVWRVEAGELVWVKEHTEERKFRQEDRAYDLVPPALADAGVRVARKVARHEELRALVLSHVPGEPAREDDPEAHRQAGTALAAIHALPYEDPDPVPLADALRVRMDRWVREGRGVVEPELIDACVARFDADAFAGARRSLCHRDWSARNWLLEGGRLGVIDFEHTGPDLWLVDLVRMAEGAWDHPGVREAFLAGYGPLPEGAADALAGLLWLTELATVVWSTNHRDRAYEAIGRRVLARLQDGWRPL